MRAGVRLVHVYAALGGFVLACGAAVLKAPPRSPAPADKPKLTPPLLLEGRDGVLGRPADETAFPFELESADALDEPPVLDGIPPLTADVTRALAPYLEVRRARLAAASGSNGILVLTRLGETTHAHRVTHPLGQREQVTFGSEPTHQASFVPTAPNLVTYRVDAAGDEAFQVLMVDTHLRRMSLLSDGKSRHGPYRWSSTGNQLAFTRLEGVADAGVWVHTAATGHSRMATQKEGQWVILNWSRDERELLLQEYIANTETRLHVLDTQTGDTQPISPLARDVSYGSAVFSADSRMIYLLSNREGEFVQLWRFDRTDTTWHQITSESWDVEEFSQSSDGRLLAYTVNADGYSRLEVYDTESGTSRRVPKAPSGVMTGLRFHTRRQLAFSLSTERNPSDAYTLDLDSPSLTRWTRSEAGGLARSAFVKARLIRYPSFDGRMVPAFLYQPKGQGPFPTLIWVHGGPESQSRPTFDPVIQYLAGRLKIAVVAPNIRGSDGYGRSYLALDDGFKRADSIADIGHLLDWIEGVPQLDSRRVGIHGASYGGYVVLASLVKYGSRIIAGSDMVGISNFVSFLENTSSYRQDIRRREYGDERNPEMRAYLQEISPLNHADRITSALLVAHGANDPRVPASEAETIVERVRAHGQPVWYMLARSEGHSFRKRTNRDKFYQVLASFFVEHLLSEPEPSGAMGAAGASPRDD